MTDNEQDFNIEDELSEEEQEETAMERFFFHQRKALEETGKALEALLPPEFRKHGSEASKEFAKGFRVLVDVTIDNLKKVSEKEDPDEEDVDEPESQPEAKKNDDDDEPPTTTGKTKVKIKLD